LDNLIYRDYAAWKMENHEMFEKFIANKNVIHARLEPIILVLDHIYDLVCSESEINEDFETIFEVGFNYLHNQIEVVKIYFENLFQSNCEDFERYSETLLYLLYINDVRNELEGNGYEVDFPNLDELETTIENMIMERREDFLYIKERMKNTLDDLFSNLEYEYVSIIDIFTQIAETIGIYDSKVDEVIVGREL